jgi:ATP adenylyltransferase
VDRLWSPWRYRYVSQSKPTDACFFCVNSAQQTDPENYIVHRGKWNFVLVNIYPYTAGHLLIAPYAHVPTLEAAPEETAAELILLARRAESVLRRVYKPEGMNLGINEGECAGAGVAGHIHMHVLPRWCGDANFMSTVGETRVLPEELGTTYERVKQAFGG